MNRAMLKNSLLATKKHRTKKSYAHQFTPKFNLLLFQKYYFKIISIPDLKCHFAHITPEYMSHFN